ncbi:DUF1508 domain-containing protein [Cellulophaga baltica]|uniref:YegP family protein n=1 Tax=Cellulophaga TaxID=104264 RepID=UPI001C065FFC|nr:MULTISPECIES: DUF1508 domain-containing protein [Cellulophaga]MBU2996126.1 DUF1508 domain-containing protein [Cellulophaga baltica]MDO6767521.1 DUF1508 domain-containing protein [Cellulophaga sp. 1_MG-2023]
MIKLNTNNLNEYSFKLENEKGITLLKSVSFTNKHELNSVVSNLQTLINTPSKFERKTNNQGDFLFNLKNEQGKIIGTSNNYNSEAGMENGIKNLKSTFKP